MKITFKYYDPTGKIVNKRKPSMTNALYTLLEKLGATWQLDTLHIVHVGTVGDERHRKDNPKSYHLHTPPDAIDVVKLYGKINGALKIHFDLRDDLLSRKEIAMRWTGKAFHRDDKTKHHLHLQTK